MNGQEAHNSVAESEAFQSLCQHFEQAGGMPSTLQTIAWKIGAHPDLIAHGAVFSNLLALLQTEVFSPDALVWASAWRSEVPRWCEALLSIGALEPTLRADPRLEPMFRAPRHTKDHPLLRHGVTRHPITAALFNSPECDAASATELSARQGYQLARAHVVAMYAEARARAARGLDDFLVHSGLKEFEPVPLGGGPVGLALREFSLARYAPLICQLPTAASTVEYAYTLSRLQPDFSELPTSLRPDAGRYFKDLQRYFAALPALLNAQQLFARTRRAGENEEGAGGHAFRPGWVGWAGTGIQRELDLDWADDAPPITIVSLPALDEDDAKTEEAEGDCPGLSRDTPLETYDPTGGEEKQEMSRNRLRRLAVELKGQQLPWSMDVASVADRTRALRAAQVHIDHYLAGGARNQTNARLAAIGGVLIKATALYGWPTESTSGIAVLPIERLDAKTVDSLAFIKQDQITLLVTKEGMDPERWSAQAFLVPAVSPRYETRLADDTIAVGRLRQTALLLADVGGLGQELLSVAMRQGRLPEGTRMARRALGVENKTARSLARACLAEAADPINEDPRANLTLARLAASVQVAIAQVSQDLVPAWMICHDQTRSKEPRLFYTQVRAAKLVGWHMEALALLDPGAQPPHCSGCLAQNLADIQPGWVGCRHVTDIERVRDVISNLQRTLCTPVDLERRTALRQYHNRYTFHAWLFQALPLALRPAKTGPGLSQTVELIRGLDASLEVDVTGVAEKHNGYQHKARLIPVMQPWMLAATQLEQHNASVISRLSLLAPWQALEPAAQRLFVILADGQLAPVTPAWIATEMVALGLSGPSNFGRALLRTEWLDRGCRGRWIDAHMGHFNHSQNFFSKHSSHDPAAHLSEIRKQLPRYLEHLTLRPIPSVLVPALDRHNNQPVGWRLPSNGLKRSLPQLKIRPNWWSVNAPPVLPKTIEGVWATVRRHAATSDQGVLDALLWLLTRSDNPHARLLTGRDAADAGPPDERSAQALVDEVLLTMQRHQLPQTCAASWLRLLLAAERRLQASGVELVVTQVAALTTEPSSPISPHATSRLADLAHWRLALHAWVRQRAVEPQEDPKYWAIAIALSAIINGMVLDALMLSRILEHLAMPGPRKLHQCGKEGEFTFLEFRLPSEAPGGRQVVRWFPDPLTELLILQAPPFLETPSLRDSGRYLNPFLIHNGAPHRRCPGGWRVVIRAARGFWSTKVPQHVVQAAQRGLSSTSLDEACWRRVFGSTILQSKRPGAVLNHVSASSTTLTLENISTSPVDTEAPRNSAHVERLSAVAGATAEAAVDIQHLILDQLCARPWLCEAHEVLAYPKDEVVSSLVSLSQRMPVGSFEHGALQWLARTATALLSEPRDDGASVNPLVDLRRVASTLLPCIALELGGHWFDGSDAQALRNISDAMLNEPFPGRSRQILARGLELLRRHEPHCLASTDVTGEAGQAPTDVAEDIEDPDHDVRVDARIITIDEYQEALSVIRHGIDPPLTTDERAMLEDLLDLGVWSLARPREYLQARLGDFQWHSGELSLSIRAYAGHDLKTPNAVRLVPLSLLAPLEVVERIHVRITLRLNQHTDPGSPEARRQLFFAPPEGMGQLEHHDHLLGLLRQILRSVTGDSHMRVYSLRHSSANWMFLALEASTSEVNKSLWAAHPAMLAWIEQGDSLRQRLLGSADLTDRRAMLAITKLMGHLAAATSFMHYLHLVGLLQLQAVRRLAGTVPDVVMAAAARVPTSTFSEQLRAGWCTVLRQARLRASWSLRTEPALDKASHAKASADPRWLSFEQLAHLLNAHARHDQPLDAIGRHFGISSGAVESVIDLGVKFGRLVGATYAYSKGDDADAGIEIPEGRMNKAERLQVRILTINLEALWRKDPRLAEDGTRLMIERTNRHHREVALDRPDQIALLCRFLGGLGVSPDEVQIVLRRRGATAFVPRWALEPLGTYRASTIKVSAPDTETADEALERWVALRLVDRKHNGIPNVVARALFAATVNMSAYGRA